MKSLEENKIREIFLSIQGGEVEQFGELYKLTYHAIYSYVKSKLYKSDSQIEDIMQEVYLAIFQNRDKYDSNQPFTPWLYGIVHHKIMDKLRETYNKEIEVALNKVDIADDFLINDLLDNEVTKIELAKLIELLSQGQREVIQLHYLGGKSVKEIADIQGINPDTVSSQLNKGRKRLKLLILQAEEKSGIQLHGIVFLPLLSQFTSPKFKAPMKMSARLIKSISNATGISNLSGITSIGGIVIMAGAGKIAAVAIATVLATAAISTGCVKLYEDARAEPAMANVEVEEYNELVEDSIDDIYEFSSTPDPSEPDEASEPDEVSEPAQAEQPPEKTQAELQAEADAALEQALKEAEELFNNTPDAVPQTPPPAPANPGGTDSKPPATSAPQLPPGWGGPPPSNGGGGAAPGTGDPAQDDGMKW